MHEYWGYCGTCKRSYPCAPADVPGALPTDFRCVRCNAVPERLEIRLDTPTGYAATSGAGAGPSTAPAPRTRGR